MKSFPRTLLMLHDTVIEVAGNAKCKACLYGCPECLEKRTSADSKLVCLGRFSSNSYKIVILSGAPLTQRLWRVAEGTSALLSLPMLLF